MFPEIEARRARAGAPALDGVDGRRGDGRVRRPARGSRSSRAAAPRARRAGRAGPVRRLDGPHPPAAARLRGAPPAGRRPWRRGARGCRSVPASRARRGLNGFVDAVRRARVGGGLRLLGDHPQLRRGIPECRPRPGCRSGRRSGVRGASPSSQPPRLSGRGLAPLSGWRATLRPRSVNICAVVGGLGAERRQEVAHHHAVEPGLDGQRLQLARGSRPGRRRGGRARRGGSAGRSRST